MSVNNIYSKLQAITSELSAVAKNLEVGVGAGRYKGVGEADVLATVKPLECKHGIYSYPVSREIIETAELVTKSGTRNLFLRLKTVYRFVNVENPAEFIDITSYGDGVDSQDKAPGKAMTYSDKYALLKAYKIITGDDPDQDKSEELSMKKPAPKKAAPKPAPVYNDVPPYEDPAAPAEPMTAEQYQIIIGLDEKLKAFACKKYSLTDVSDLSAEQANHIIGSLRAKGVIK